ncbi:MAG: dCTP deaminase [Pseudanabaenaceae cyanobacterium bins.68]|nr:dCTP deaminase [Pseudanabaenaceae cyanobacterium bins.68]
MIGVSALPAELGKAISLLGNAKIPIHPDFQRVSHQSCCVSMLKNDRWILAQAEVGMIAPFEPALVRQVEAQKVISYGLSSYGYDLRLSDHDFRVFRHIPGTVIDPKNFNPGNLEPAPLHQDAGGTYFILPAHSYGLGVALERLAVPENVTVICIGKSTYARCGIIANLTPAEAGWRGHLTLEFSNSSSADCRIYANEGVVQLLFLEGEPCQTTYADRAGKYQDQAQTVTLAKV